MNLPECDDPVFVPARSGTNPLPGTIVQTNRDRSYEVQPLYGVFRRNRRHLRSRPEESSPAPVTVDRPEPSVVPV